MHQNSVYEETAVNTMETEVFTLSSWFIIKQEEILENIMNKKSKTMLHFEQRGASASANAFRHLSPYRQNTTGLFTCLPTLDDPEISA